MCQCLPRHCVRVPVSAGCVTCPPVCRIVWARRCARVSVCVSVRSLCMCMCQPRQCVCVPVCVYFSVCVPCVSCQPRVSMCSAARALSVWVGHKCGHGGVPGSVCVSESVSAACVCMCQPRQCVCEPVCVCTSVCVCRVCVSLVSVCAVPPVPCQCGWAISVGTAVCGPLCESVCARCLFSVCTAS